MPNIRVDIDYTIKDGTEIKFRSPVDCSQITGLIVYYPGVDGNTVSKVFVLADAHGNNVGDIDHLFAEDVVVKVILDVTKGMAFVQNADTNAYLEAALAGKAPAGYGYGETMRYVSASTEAKLEEALDALLETLDAQKSMQVCVNCSAIIALTGACVLSKTSNSNGGYAILTHHGYHDAVGVSVTRKVKIGGVWYPAEYENPKMVIGEEYRTTDRIHAKAVYKKADSNGNISYRLDGETAWYPEGAGITKLWENAGPASNFAAQTISLNLSKYQMVAIECRFNTTDDYRKIYFGNVGSAMALDVVSTSGYLGWRSAAVTTTGISFSTATYNKNSGVVGYVIPVAIYGIKGVI